jgi:hypothetical protein
LAQLLDREVTLNLVARLYLDHRGLGDLAQTLDRPVASRMEDTT